MKKTKIQNWWNSLSDEEKVNKIDNYFGKTENINIFHIREMYNIEFFNESFSFIRIEGDEKLVNKIKNDLNTGNYDSIIDLLSFIPNEIINDYLTN